MEQTKKYKMGILDDNLPIGSKDNPDAPWNENPSKEIEVVVSITLSKSMKLLVEDVEDNYSDYLKDMVEQQYHLPQDAGHILGRCAKYNGFPTKKNISDLSGWNIDDFTVIEE